MAVIVKLNTQTSLPEGIKGYMLSQKTNALLWAESPLGSIASQIKELQQSVGLSQCH